MWSEMTNIDWAEVHFAYPWAFALLLALPFIYYYFFYKKKFESTLTLSSLRLFQAKKTWRIQLRKYLPWFRIIALALLIVALARPQELNSRSWIESEGYDIILCIDVSWSMMSEDFKPNRLEVAKEMSSEFVKQRMGDRVGLVEFWGRALLKVPLTTDLLAVQESTQALVSDIENEGTAIGDAVATAIDRLKEAQSKSKIVVLLTDGEENSGFIDAGTATEIAKAFDVKVYTIGVGSSTSALLPIPDENGQVVKRNVPVNIDEKTLKSMANETGGKYFRATNKGALAQIYNEINQLEKSTIKSQGTVQAQDVFMIFVFFAFVFIALEWVLRYGLLKTMP